MNIQSSKVILIFLPFTGTSKTYSNLNIGPYENPIAFPITSSAVPNNLILFPSWLSHMVHANKTNVVRKSISFNIILRGKYGNKDSRQEVML